MHETNVLIIAASPFHLALMGDLLEANGIATRHAPGALAALKDMAAGAPNLVILDLDLPLSEGRLLVEGMKRLEHLRQIPVLSVGSTRQRAAFEAVRQLGVVEEEEGLATPIDTGMFPRRVLREIQRQTTTTGRPALL